MAEEKRDIPERLLQLSPVADWEKMLAEAQQWQRGQSAPGAEELPLAA